MNAHTEKTAKPIESESEDETETEDEEEAEIESSEEDLLYGLSEEHDDLSYADCNEASLANSGSFFQDSKLALEVISRLQEKEFPFHVLFEKDKFYCDPMREVLFEIYQDNKHDEDDSEILYLMGYFLIRQLAERQTSIQDSTSPFIVSPPASLDSLMKARLNLGEPLLTADQLFFVAQYYHTGPDIHLERACKYYQLAIDAKQVTRRAASVAALQKIAREQGGIAYFYLGQCYQYGYLREAKEENAMTCYEKVKSISAGAAFYLGERYFHFRRWKAAVEAYAYCWMQHGADNAYSKHALAALQSIHPKKRLHKWCDFLTQQYEGPIDSNEIERLISLISAYLGKLSELFIDRKLAIDFLSELKENYIDPEKHTADNKAFFGPQTEEILLRLQEKYPYYKDHDEISCLIAYCKKQHTEKSSTGFNSYFYTALREKMHEAGLKEDKEKEAYRVLREKILPVLRLICDNHSFWNKDAFREKIEKILKILNDDNKTTAEKYVEILEKINEHQNRWGRLLSAKKLSTNAITLISAVRGKDLKKLETLERKVRQVCDEVVLKGDDKAGMMNGHY